MSPTPLQRALASAPERPPEAKARAEREFFCFKLGGLSLGVPSETVREVARLGLLTPLPRTPSFLLGVFAHRGEVLPALDLLRLLGKGESRVVPRSRLFVATSGSFIAAVVVDVAVGLRKFPLSEILPPPVGGEGGLEQLIGVVRAGEQGAFSLLDLSKLLAAARQKVTAR